MNQSTPVPETSRRRDRPPRHRRLLTAASIVALAGLTVAVMVRQPAPIGHWNSTAAHDTYLADYQRAFADLPEPAQTLDLRTTYGVVRVYRFAGSGPAKEPMMLLPGTMSGTPIWADNLPSLLRIGDVYALDLLGEPGMSVQSLPIVDHADQADWLDQVLAQLPQRRTHLIGLSIGGWTAANLALRNPRHLASLTLIDPINVFDTIPLETAIRATPAVTSWMPSSWRDSFNSYLAGGAPVEGVAVADMIESGMRGYTPRLPQPSLLDPERIADLDLPVLAIIAGQSVIHHPATAIATARRALPGQVVVYQDASHAISGEYPDRIASDIAAFITA